MWSRGSCRSQLAHLRVSPSIPQASECEQLSIIDFEAVRLLCFTFPFVVRGPTLLWVPPLRTVRESFQLTRLKLPGTPKS